MEEGMEERRAGWHDNNNNSNRRRGYGIGIISGSHGDNNRSLLLLPISQSSSCTSNSNSNRMRRSRWRLSCWYWEYRMMFLNSILYSSGRTHSTFLILWFSIGLGFSLAALFSVSLILVVEVGSFVGVLPSSTTQAASSLLFGLSPSSSSPSPWVGLSFSIADTPYLFLSTLLSVSFHEFGHAISAASEGIQMEYIAIFVALVFPGALVAFNSDLLLALPRVSALRIYCAGVWHNAVLSAVCGLTLFLLPLILWPFYTHGERLMVLDVQSTSPLSGYLSPGDIIVSLDGKAIHDEQEWKETISLIHKSSLQRSNHPHVYEDFLMVHSGSGYCVPQFLIDNNYRDNLLGNQSACSDSLTEFRDIPCVDSNKLVDVNTVEGYSKSRDGVYCLKAADIVKLKKCGNGWLIEATNGSKCSCSQDLWCMSPVQFPGSIWIEINYTSPYAGECLNRGRSSSEQTEDVDLIEQNCGGTFVFVGDPMSMENSVHLTGYQPRLSFTFAAYFPQIMEKLLTCTFHVSLTIALLNSLPVFFLDGQSILEVALCCVRCLASRKREKLLQACLLGGTLISLVAFTRDFVGVLYD